DPDLAACRQTLRRVILRTDSNRLAQLERFSAADQLEETTVDWDTTDALGLHYLLWGKKGGEVGVSTVQESLEKWHRNKSARKDLNEVVAWRRAQQAFPTAEIALPFACALQLHAAYG